MTEAIKQLTDIDLLDIYRLNAEEIMMCRRKPTTNNCYRMPGLVQDRVDILEEVESRLPNAYKWELEEIKKGLVHAARIKPGNRYRHVAIKALTIKIVDSNEFIGPMYTAMVFISKIYACRMQLKVSTIVEHFVKIEDHEQ